MDHEKTWRSLCGNALYAGRCNSDHDREDEGDGENNAIGGREYEMSQE